MHISSTPGHHADYDGDEGNLHFPQDIQSQLEVRYLMSPRNSLMLPLNSSPVTGIIFNSISGAFLLTKPGLMLTKSIFEEGIRSIVDYQ